MSDDFAAALLGTDAEPEPEVEATPDTTEATEEAPAVEAAPEPAWWETAGFSDEASALKKVSNLSKWEKDVQRQASEAGRSKPEPAPAPAPVVDDDGDPFAALDPESAKLLKRAIEKQVAERMSEVAPQAALAEHLFRDQQRKAFESFAESEGIDPAELAEVMDSYNLQPTDATSEAFQKVYEAGAAIYRRNNPTDIDAEVERRLADKLAEMKKDGATVKAVEPHKAEVTEEKDDEMDDPGFFAKMLGR